MTLKNLKIIDIFIIFILTFLFHFAYDLFPNKLFTILFPVNESIWEHMKLLYTPVIVSGVIDMIISIKKNIKFNNLFISIFLSSLISIITYLIIYLPVNSLIGYNSLFAITLLFLIIILNQYISYKILSSKGAKKINIIAIIFIIIGFIIFGYLTYNPIKSNLFYDTKNEKYGINIYKI